ncbi:hypothetical protein AC579_10630 [Pseudocercospora musae]|uniref:Uncharacterized protein n=1 Tax=Pseudocercospora musae TaxID=113226 RepID=A0A139HKI2_9PEZI|nr:hypothetical protein AC579_10630 [Pseudocercospora musae]
MSDKENAKPSPQQHQVEQKSMDKKCLVGIWKSAPDNNIDPSSIASFLRARADLDSKENELSQRQKMLTELFFSELRIQNSTSSEKFSQVFNDMMDLFRQLQRDFGDLEQEFRREWIETGVEEGLGAGDDVRKEEEEDRVVLKVLKAAERRRKLSRDWKRIEVWDAMVAQTK